MTIPIPDYFDFLTFPGKWLVALLWAINNKWHNNRWHHCYLRSHGT